MDLICFAAVTREPGRSLFVSIDSVSSYTPVNCKIKERLIDRLPYQLLCWQMEKSGYDGLVAPVSTPLFLTSMLFLLSECS